MRRGRGLPSTTTFERGRKERPRLRLGTYLPIDSIPVVPILQRESTASAGAGGRLARGIPAILVIEGSHTDFSGCTESAFYRTLYFDDFGSSCDYCVNT